MDLRYDLKSGFETFVGAAAAGSVRNVVTQHPANPVPKTNWFVDGGLVAGGLLLELAGDAMRMPLVSKIGQGALLPGFAYSTADLVQLGRNKLAANAASATPNTAAFTMAPAFAPAPSYGGGGGAGALGDF
jgi:hypothetical protein